MLTLSKFSDNLSLENQQITLITVNLNYKIVKFSRVISSNVAVRMNLDQLRLCVLISFERISYVAINYVLTLLIA